MVGIFDPACELLPPWTKELYLCTVNPLPSIWPAPPQGNCVVDHIMQEFYTLLLTRFRTYKIASPSPTKITSKDDI